MKSNTLRSAVVLVVLAIAAYWYWSPFLAMHQMREAARAGDADTFNDYVDYLRLRESLKGQFSARLTEQMASEPQPKNDFAKAGAALGSMFAIAMVDKMVDAFVRPEVVMRGMQQGQVVPKRAPAASASGAAADDADKVTWTSERKSVDKLIAYANKPGQAENQRVGFVMERVGFVRWKLTEIRLPEAQ